MRDPRTFDLYTRTVTTSAIVLVVLLVIAYQALTGSVLEETFKTWGGLIIGAYFGAHVSQNGAAARARQDQKLAETIVQPLVEHKEG